MIKLGVRAFDFEPASPLDLVEKATALGVKYLQLPLEKTFPGFDLFSDDYLAIAELLERNNLNVALLSSYFNPVHPDENKRRLGIKKFIRTSTFTTAFSCPLVATETGSLNGDKWTYNPLNHEADAFAAAKVAFTEIMAECNVGAIIALEPAWAHVVYDLKVLTTFVEDSNLTRFALVLDLFNLLNATNYKTYQEIMETAITLFGRRLKIMHAKNFRIEDDNLIPCALPDGYIDYPWLISRIKAAGLDVTLITEGLRGADLARSIKYLQALIDN